VLTFHSDPSRTTRRPSKRVRLLARVWTDVPRPQRALSNNPALLCWSGAR